MEPDQEKVPTKKVQGAARGLAWRVTALALIGELGVGAATASSLQLGLGVAAALGGIGFVFLLMGLGLVWAVRPELAKAPATARRPSACAQFESGHDVRRAATMGP